MQNKFKDFILHSVFIVLHLSFCIPHSSFCIFKE
jgi:hypothetical protein